MKPANSHAFELRNFVAVLRHEELTTSVSLTQKDGLTVRGVHIHGKGDTTTTWQVSLPFDTLIESGLFDEILNMLFLPNGNLRSHWSIADAIESHIMNAGISS